MRRSPKRRRDYARPDDNEPRVNDRIRVPRVLVIDEEGNRLGEFLTRDAIQLAADRGLDLVEVAPNGRPPVCRITDFGKLKYDRKKKAAAARRNQVQVQLKEVKLRPKTDDHDLAVKVGHARRFLESGNKVKVTVRFRGRELAHRDIGVDQCLRVFEAVKELSAIESRPRMEGRQMFMILAPTKKPVRKRAASSDEEAPEEELEDEFTEEEDLDEDDFTEDEHDLTEDEDPAQEATAAD